jgi:WD40 repeat protein
MGRRLSAVVTTAFSPDGQRIVSGSSDRKMRLWDANTGKQLGAPFKGHKDAVSTVAFSHDGKQIVSGSNDTTVRLWDAMTGKQIGQPLNDVLRRLRCSERESSLTFRY